MEKYLKKSASVFVLGIAAACAASAQLLGVGAGVSAGVGLSGAVRGATNLVNQTAVDVDANVRSRASVRTQADVNANVEVDEAPAAAVTSRDAARTQGRVYESGGAYGGVREDASARVGAQADVRVPRVDLGVQSGVQSGIGMRGGAFVR